MSRDPRHLSELRELAVAWRPLFPGDPEVHETELERMQALILKVQRARSVRVASAAELVEQALRRVARVRRWVLAPQEAATRRPSLIQRVTETVLDVPRFAQAEPGRFTQEVADAQRIAASLDTSLAQTRAARSALDAVAFTDALAEELRAAIHEARTHEEPGMRVMALDRVLEAQRQFALSAAEPRALAMTRAALLVTRNRGPYAVAPPTPE